MSLLETSVGGLVAMAVMSLAGTASAQAPPDADNDADNGAELVVATDPAPPPAPTTTVAVPLPSSTTPAVVAPVHAPTSNDGVDEHAGGDDWYGDDVLVAAAITVPMMVGNSAAVAYGGDNEIADVGLAYGVLSTIAHLVTGPAIQAAGDGDDAPYKIGTSAALRSGMLATSGTTALVICSATDTCSDGVIVGAVAAGAALPVLIETAFLSWKDAPDEKSHGRRDRARTAAITAPYVAPTKGGAALGVAGTF
jgi:hypothetical protein